MFTRIELLNGNVYYENKNVLIKKYILETINPLNNIRSQYDISIYFNNQKEFKDKFIVKDMFGLDFSFDTFNDANNFAYKTIADKIEKQDEEIRQIRAYIDSKKKKKRRRIKYEK